MKGDKKTEHKNETYVVKVSRTGALGLNSNPWDGSVGLNSGDRRISSKGDISEFRIVCLLGAFQDQGTAV